MTNIMTTFISLHAVQLRNRIVTALMLTLLASNCVFAQANGEAGKVLHGQAAFGDWREDAPGVRRLITPRDLPDIGQETVNIVEVVPPPSGVRPQVPKGFSAEMVTSGLAQPRVIRVAPNGDLFVANSSANEVRVYRVPSGSAKPAVSEVFAA